jgi:endoglucanase
MRRLRNLSSLWRGYVPSACVVSVGLMASGCAVSEAPVSTTTDPNAPIESVDSVEQADTYTGKVLVNQFGYLTNATKIGLVVYSADTATTSWELRKTADNSVVKSGTTVKVSGTDQGDYLHKIDFSTFTTVAGDNAYKLCIANSTSSTYCSVNFTVAKSLYGSSPGTSGRTRFKEAMKYFYLQRQHTTFSSTYLDMKFVTSNQWAGVTNCCNDSAVKAYGGWTSDTFNVDGGHDDAGDHGKYLDNTAVYLWKLMNLYEWYKIKHSDSWSETSVKLVIPESANGKPDILDEISFGAKYVPGMMPASSSKLAGHKIHENGGSTRSVMNPSTTATYSVARVEAQLSRLIKPFDSAKADTLWGKAKTAWTRATTLTTTIYPRNMDNGGASGGYQDKWVGDDKYAAAVEMYLTAIARGESFSTYKSAVTGSTYYKRVGDFDWGEEDGNDAACGTISLLTVLPSDLTTNNAADITAMKANLKTYADGIITIQNGQGYPSALAKGAIYPWGSNGFQLGSVMLLIMAYELNVNGSSSINYLKAAHRVMDYMMGVNPMKKTYILGWGEKSEKEVSDETYSKGLPWGWVPGGPINRNDFIPPQFTSPPCDSAETHTKNKPIGQGGKGYVPDSSTGANASTGSDSWCSKEQTTDINAALAWAVYGLEYNRTALAP